MQRTTSTPPGPDRAVRRRRLGVDVGGTFTDFLYWDGQALHIAKRPSTPRDPSRAILDGVAARGWAPEEVIHGSTIATNTLLTRQGARTAVITTAGFADTLEIGRQARPVLYALHPTRPEPLVPRRLRFEVRERIAAGGTILTPLDDTEVEAVLDRIVARRVQAVAVCLLFGFLHPAHERRIAERARARGLLVAASHEVLPEHREFERMSTTVANAYLAPSMRRYLSALDAGLAARAGGAPGRARLRIMQSNGGSMTAAQASAMAVRTVLSGPAGGVVGAFAAAAASGFPHVITLDMGGTSADVSLCPGRILERTDLSVDEIPIRTAAVDVHTVGAGGGSIAWIDTGGALRVGPHSAGANPGPAAYGRGTRATVTDAHLVLGRLRPDRFLGGAMPLDAARARRAVASLAEHFGGDLARTARAILDVVNANMVRALRVISVERGNDPSAFALLAFGGAGPLHACDLAAELDIRTVIIPPTPGVLSAAGMLQADVTHQEVQGLVVHVAPDARGRIERLEAVFAALESRARAAMTAAGDVHGVQVERSADLRYAGQSHELAVPLPPRRGRGRIDARDLQEALAAAHEERFAHHDPTRAVEVVVARVTARAPGFRLPPVLGATEGPPPPSITTTVTWDRPRRTRVQERSAVERSGVTGPALLTQLDTTIAVPPGWRARPDARGMLVLRHV